MTVNLEPGAVNIDCMTVTLKTNDDGSIVTRKVQSGDRFKHKRNGNVYEFRFTNDYDGRGPNGKWAMRRIAYLSNNTERHGKRIWIKHKFLRFAANASRLPECVQ